MAGTIRTTSLEPHLVENALVVAPLGLHLDAEVEVHARAEVALQLRSRLPLLISADLEELLGLSDTLKVMLRGRVVATLDPARVTPIELGSYMTGAALEDEEPAPTEGTTP